VKLSRSKNFKGLFKALNIAKLTNRSSLARGLANSNSWDMTYNVLKLIETLETASAADALSDASLVARAYQTNDQVWGCTVADDVVQKVLRPHLGKMDQELVRGLSRFRLFKDLGTARLEAGF
jgi:hypothetical protein